VDLQLHSGEVLGLYGLVGSGRTELLETLFGARRSAAGSLSLDGKRLTIHRPAAAIAAGIALVPSDRTRKGVIAGLSAERNVCLTIASRLSRLGFRRPRAERAAFNSMATALQLRPHRPTFEARRFSGGNQQKLVVGRWLHPQLGCQVLLLDEPTQGVDVGARADLYSAIRRFVGTDRAAIVASSEPGELQQLADRVIVLSHGRPVAVLAGNEITESRLLAAAHLSEQPGGPS